MNDVFQYNGANQSIKGGVIVRIKSDQVIFNMSAENRPVARVKSGDTVTFETLDCFSCQIKDEGQALQQLDWNAINPATGPVYVEEAQPGDILKVEILDISIADFGVMAVIPGAGALGDIISTEQTKLIPIRDGKAIFNDKLQLPIKPMIGVIGTAPKGEAVPTGTPMGHGGNMDCKRIVQGASLYLPVNVPGALLALGDLHAVMADGEIVVTGLEIAGEVTVKVSVLKDITLPLPLLVEGDELITIASAETLDEAALLATKNMHSLLTNHLHMEVNEAGMLLSLVGELKICQIVDPLKTARMELPLWILDRYGFKL